MLTWKFDRLTRQQRDLARVLEACALHRGFIASITEPIDTREPHGQFVAELLVAQARMESANTSARQRRKAQEQREQGLPPTNGKRTFGYRRKYEGVVAEEAAIIRETRDRLFAGESLRSICLDLNDRGIRSTDGNGIRDQIFKRLLTSPTIAAERELDGHRYPGNWPAIITPDESRRLALLLNRRPGMGREMPARKYLLTGMVRCGRCGGRMSAHAKAGGYRRYVCTKSPGYPNCGSMSVTAEPLEEIVREMVIAAVDDGRLREAVNTRADPEDGVMEAVRRDEESLAQLSRDHYADRVISREEYFAARDELNRGWRRTACASRNGQSPGSWSNSRKAPRFSVSHGTSAISNGAARSSVRYWTTSLSCRASPAACRSIPSACGRCGGPRPHAASRSN